MTDDPDRLAREAFEAQREKYSRHWKTPIWTWEQAPEWLREDWRNFIRKEQRR